MEIDWYSERLGALQDWPEELVVKIAALNMTVDHSPFEAKIVDTVRSNSAVAASGAAVGNAANPAKRLGFFCTASARMVVRLTSECHCLGRIQLF